MKIQRSWLLSVLTIIALVIAGHEVRAQSYPAGPGAQDGYYATGAPQAQYPPAMPPGGPGGYPAPAAAPAGYRPAMPGPAAMPYGAPQPAAYYQGQQDALQPIPQGQGVPMQGMPMQGAPMMGAPGMDAYGPMPGQAWCEQCGGYGCGLCAGHDDFDLKLLRWLLPYGAGGCHAQRWYDISADWIYLKRDDVGDSQPFTSEGLAGPIVLDSDDLNFDEASGVRASAAVMLGAGNNLEATYIGAANWAAAAQVTGNDNLFSVMSEFGVAPFNGFDDTDRARLHRIEYSSSFDTIGLNYRQRWVAPNARVQGSWLVGVRYMYLDEDFRYLTEAPANPGSMDYLVNTTNSMTGPQIGGDLWVCIMPGLKIGGEGRIGLFGNQATQRTYLSAESLAMPYTEKVSSDLVSFLGDANVTLLWKVNQNWTFRAGYMFLFMDSVALASENFNPDAPFVAGLRVPVVDDTGELFYHGATVGAEWMW